MATTEHEATSHNGRVICTCGDFNCASLDAVDSHIQLGEN